MFFSSRDYYRYFTLHISYIFAHFNCSFQCVSSLTITIPPEREINLDYELFHTSIYSPGVVKIFKQSIIVNQPININE